MPSSVNDLPTSANPLVADSADAQDFLTREIAPLSVDILIEGETGTGKDVLAREIHSRSRRPGKFIAINCAAVPEHIAESELFGYEAGAFTGATRAKEGKLEAAHQGTLYLDEIDSMPINIQAKLLRALQERGTERLGGSHFYRSDFRVIASTKISLPTLVEQGDFRRDLYFRLNVVKLRLPALRDSREKIAPLFAEFLNAACIRHDRTPPVSNSRIQKLLMEYPWPGNIRELKNAAERYSLGLPPLEEERAETVAATAWTAADKPAESSIVDDGSLSLRDRVRAFEADLILSTLRRHGQSVLKASRALNISSNTLYYRIKTLGIRIEGAAATPDRAEPPAHIEVGRDAGDVPEEAIDLNHADHHSTLPVMLQTVVKQRFTATFRCLINTTLPGSERLIFPDHELAGAVLDAIHAVCQSLPCDKGADASIPDCLVDAAINTTREAIQDICADLRRETGDFFQDMVNRQSANRYAKTAKDVLDSFRPRIGDTQRLFDELLRTPGLARIERRHAWRLCIDPLKVDLMRRKGLDTDNNPYIGHLFDSEAGYLHHMGRAWMLAVHDIDRRLDLDLIVRLQAFCTGQDGAMTRKPAGLPQACQTWAQFGMLPGETLSESGRQELADFVGTHATHAAADPSIRFTLYTKPAAGGAEYKILKRDEAPLESLKKLMERWIDDYHAAQSFISFAHEDRRSDEKVRAAVELCQKMQRLRPFPDGNCRTFGILLLNRLLIQQGEPLTMIDNPNKFDGFSLGEMLELVRQGQTRATMWRKRETMGADIAQGSTREPA